MPSVWPGDTLSYAHEPLQVTTEFPNATNSLPTEKQHTEDPDLASLSTDGFLDAKLFLQCDGAHSITQAVRVRASMCNRGCNKSVPELCEFEGECLIYTPGDAQ